ncbi:hypothetical protein RHSIM_Rhsim11G0114700 [Rhododendron simsii]|uniref:Uncharacterized protein n=1 Tax=Rhododendron simsii TaxID=118357 RepID=A0A834GDY0_RHOSS|nr:hypothetical protein RHSIM_Rhsim11G0114700 [Rhododendron simsii]
MGMAQEEVEEEVDNSRTQMKTISSVSPVLKLVCGSSSGFGFGFGSGLGFGNCSGSCSKIVAKRSKNTNRPSQKGSEPAPPRITTNVKHSLQVLKHWNDYQKRKAGTPKPVTSYRRKKAEKEDLPEDDSELYLDETILQTINQLPLCLRFPVITVDASCKIAYLNREAILLALLFGPQYTLTQIPHTMIVGIFTEMKVVVVFDAMMSGHSTHKETFHGVDIVYTGDMCADTWIEREVTALKEDGCPDVWVATSDHVHQQVAHGAVSFVASLQAAFKKRVERNKLLELELIETLFVRTRGLLSFIDTGLAVPYQVATSPSFTHQR